MQGVLGDFDPENPQYIIDELYISCESLPLIVTKIFEMNSSIVKSVSGKNLSQIIDSLLSKLTIKMH